MSVFKGARVSRCQCLKVQRVTRVPRLKGQLRDRVFLRSHLRSSLTPEEGPSCQYLKLSFDPNFSSSEGLPESEIAVL